MHTQAHRPLRLNVLLDQQLWFLGHDIRHPEGNALLRFGFTRQRSASGGGTTCYRFASCDGHRDDGTAVGQSAIVPHGDELLCWGFGLYHGEVASPMTVADTSVRRDTPAGVLLFRHAASARLVWPAVCLPLHKPSELPRLDLPQTEREREQLCRCVVRLARTLFRYEQWVAEALGVAYRTQVMDALPRHKRRKFVDSINLSGLWRELEAQHLASM